MITDSKKKKVLILGGGISGLTAAWELSGQKELYDVTLLEKKSRVGGQIETDSSSGFLFEHGPRIFKTSSSQPLLDLIKETGLEKELIFSSPEARKRFLWADGKLRAIPSFYVLKKLIPPLLKEWSVSFHDADESVWDFAARRFNRWVADYLFDAMVIGVFAGDSRSISLQAAFPQLKELEKKYGSLTRAFLSSKKKKDSMPSLFTLKNGVQQLVSTLEEQLRGVIYCNEEAVSVSFNAGGALICTPYRTLQADLLICALPPEPLAQLFAPLDSSLADHLRDLKVNKIKLAHIGYSSSVLAFKGFGYLVPTVEQEEILGTVFDSVAFPQHNQSPNETRLTMLLREGEHSSQGYENLVIEGLRKHLRIPFAPNYLRILDAPSGIPQYHLGHQGWAETIIEMFRHRFPQVHLLGNYFSGASVSNCVARVLDVVKKL